MAKILFVLVVLCGLASLDVSFAEPTTYGGMPAPAKYEAPAMEEKYPMKPEYKKMEDKYEEKKEEYPMKPEYKKMEDGGKKNYKRSFDDETEGAANDAKKITKVKSNVVSIKKINQLRDAVIQDVLADPTFGLGFRYRRYPYFGLYRPFPYYGFGRRRFPYYRFGRRRFPYYGFGRRRFGYHRFFDGKQDSTSAHPADLDLENDGDSEEFDAIPTPQRKWRNDVDEDQLMDDDSQGDWWSPEELDETMDPLPIRRTCSVRGGRRLC